MPFLFWLDVVALCVSAVIATSLALIALGAGPGRALNRSFAIFALLETTWAAFSLLLRLALWLERGDPLLWGELATLAFVLMGPFLLLFTTCYVGRRTRWTDLVATLGAAAITALSVPLLRHQLVFDPRLDVNGSTTMEVSGWGLALAAVPALYFVWSLALFWQERRRVGEPYLALSVLILLFGFVIGGLLEVSFPILSVTNTFSVALLGYGVVSRQLFNPLQERTAELQREIVERARVEAALRQSEERFRTLVDSMDDVVFTLDREQRYVGVFGRWLEKQGMPAEAFLGRTAREILGAEAAEIHEAANEGALAGEDVVYEWWLETPAGTQHYQTLVSPLRDSGGGIVGVVGVGRDITELKRAEEALREREQFLTLLNDITRAALETADLPTMLQILADRLGELFDADGCYLTLWDEVAQRTVPAAAYGQWRETYRSVQIEPGERTVTRSVLQAGRTLVVGDVYSSPYLSERIARLFPDRSLLALPLIAGDQKLGAALIAFNELHDFTPTEIVRGEQAAAQIALAVAKAQSVQALQAHIAELQVRNEELDSFAHTVAHDLKSPLAQIVGFAEMLEENYPVLRPEEVHRNQRRIARIGRRMSDIVDELLLLSSVRQADVEMHPLDMAAIVAEARRRLADVIEERQAKVVVPVTWPVAWGYAPWVEEVWVNYLSNAIKYGGRPPRVELGAEEQADGMIRFWIRDNGPGLTPEEQARLFVPFTKLSQVRVKGHGLGLSIVRRVVEKLGGEVGVESEGVSGRGAIFYFTLAAKKGEAR